MVRGVGRGGRGMPGRGGMGRPPFNRPRVLMLRPPFDLILAEPAFPRCKPAPDDSALTQVLPYFQTLRKEKLGFCLWPINLNTV